MVRPILMAVLACVPALCWAQSGSLYQEAMADVKGQRPDLAIPILEKIVTATPRDLKARNLLGIALMEVQRKEDAAAQFQSALAIDPKFAPALKNLAMDEIAMGRTTEARGHLERVLPLTPEDPAVHLALAEMEFAKKNYRQAIDHYKKSGGLYLADPKVILHFAQTSLNVHDYDSATQAIGKIPPGADAELHFEAGVLLAGANRHAEAAAQFGLAQNGYPDRYQVGFNIALSQLNAHNYAASAKAGEDLIAHGYRKAEVYNLLSRAYELGGRTQDAYDTLRTATQIDPNDENNYVDLMTLALEHGNLELSLQISDVALSRAPKAYRVHLQRGAVLALQGHTSDAENEFLSVTRLAPDLSAGYAALAMVRIQTGKLSEAIEGLRARRPSAPDDYPVNYYLGRALIQQGVEPGTPEDKEAAEALARAIKVNPEAAPPRVLLGKLLLADGQLDRAAREFTRALAIDPGDLSPAYQLAVIYRKQGNTKKADELFELFSKSKQVDPDQAARRDLLNLIQKSAGR